MNLTCQLKFCEEKLSETLVSLEYEKRQRKTETEILAKKLAELTKQVIMVHKLNSKMWPTRF